MNDAAYLENSIVCIFGDILHLANFLVSKGKPGSWLLFASSKDVVHTLVLRGEYEVLAQLLTSRIDANLRLDSREISYGWQTVKLAAFNQCLLLIKRTLATSGQENELEKTVEAVKSLRAIENDSRLGAAVNNFAKRQADSIELRRETPSNLRWFNGTGRYQAFWGTVFRAYLAKNSLQRHYVPVLPARAKALAW